MNRLVISILFLISILINGCDNSIEPTQSKTFGENTINTKIVNFKIIGFSFSQGGNIIYPNSQNIIPDIMVLVQIDEFGNILGVFFSSADALKPSFDLIETFNNKDSAEVFFNNLNEVSDSHYVDLALPVKENQIWAVKTVDNKHGKILILYTDAYADSSNPSTPTPYGEATFRWNYQPNGSRNF